MTRALQGAAASADEPPTCLPSPRRPRSPARSRSCSAAASVRSLYQPIVDLDTGIPVAYEALARGPEGSPLESPRELFAAAHASGSVAELDRACRGAAIAGALAAGLQAPQRALHQHRARRRAGRRRAADPRGRPARGRLRVVVELTERALTDRPAEVLAAVAWLRERGCGIALDDVGVDERSLALMPFLAPDVIKLDMSPDPGARRLAGRGARAQRGRRGGRALRRGAARRGDRERGAPRTGARGRRDARPGLAVRPPRATAGRLAARRASTACRCARTRRFPPARRSS